MSGRTVWFHCHLTPRHLPVLFAQHPLFREGLPSRILCGSSGAVAPDVGGPGPEQGPRRCSLGAAAVDRYVQTDLSPLFLVFKNMI